MSFTQKEIKKLLALASSAANGASLVVESSIFWSLLSKGKTIAGTLFKPFAYSRAAPALIEVYKGIKAETRGDRISSSVKVISDGLTGLVIFMKAELKDKVHLFTIPILLTAIIKIADSCRQNAKLTFSEKLDLVLNLLQTVGVLFTINYPKEGDVIEKNEQGMDLEMLQLFGAAVSACIMVLRAMLAFRNPLTALHSRFFGKAEELTEGLLNGQKSGETADVEKQAVGTDASINTTPKIHVSLTS